MKKLFIVLAVASLGFAACNNGSDKKAGETTDTATKQNPPAVMDTGSQAMPMADTSGAAK